ncbi:MAG: class I SAM-dependent methyltransferase [Armatimonadetes bacterium]|nr:class I SAM-dependent methyltransferase [Armatimonadota bacterium]
MSKTSGDFWRTSAEAWTRRVDEGDANRDLLLDPVMLGLLGDVTGSRILDLGCGEGRFCRMLTERHAVPVGIDPTPELIAEAAARDPNGRYLLGEAEQLEFEDGCFDTVVSYLTLCDIADYKAAISECFRVLKPGGRLLLANINSVFGGSAIRGWLWSEEGERLHVPVDHVTFESGARIEWAGIHIVNFHRSTSDYLTTLLDAGFQLTNYLEPVPTPEAISLHPGLADGLRVPNFVVMAWVKPDTSN